MRRRTALALSGTALAGLAGCASRQNDATDGPLDTGTDGSGSLSVGLDALQPAAVKLFVDAYEFEATDDSQYLFLNGADARGSDCRFRFDGSEYEPGAKTSYDLVRAPSTFGPPTESDDWVVFDLPETGGAEEAALVCPDGEWRPDAALRDRLAAPLPSLQVAFDGPSSVPAGDRPRFTVTVSNESDTDARFLGIFRRSYGALGTGQLVSRPVEAGSTVTLDATGGAAEAPTPGSGRGNSLTYRLLWPGGRDTTTLAVE